MILFFMRVNEMVNELFKETNKKKSATSDNLRDWNNCINFFFSNSYKDIKRFNENFFFFSWSFSFYFHHTLEKEHLIDNAKPLEFVTKEIIDNEAKRQSIFHSRAESQMSK